MADPGEGPGVPPPPLLLDQTEAQRGKNFFGDRAPRYLRVWITAPRPLSQGLDLALPETRKFWFMAHLRAGNSRNMSNRNVGLLSTTNNYWNLLAIWSMLSVFSIGS